MSQGERQPPAHHIGAPSADFLSWAMMPSSTPGVLLASFQQRAKGPHALRQSAMQPQPFKEAETTGKHHVATRCRELHCLPFKQAALWAEHKRFRKALGSLREF